MGLSHLLLAWVLVVDGDVLVMIYEYVEDRCDLVFVLILLICM